MEKWTVETEIFTHPFNCIISGPTSCGKTHFLKNLLENRHILIKNSQEKIIFCYKTWQNSYSLIKNNIPNVIFNQGLLESEQLDSLTDAYIIFDDLNNECINCEYIMNLFTVGSHHQRISVFVLTQNIFAKGKYSRDISLNTNYIILFRNPRDQLQLQIFARQMFPGNSKFLIESFNDATKKPYSYLLIDLKQTTEQKNRIQSGILPGELRIIYTSK